MTTDNSNDKTQTLSEREKFIKEEILPKIPKMSRYLGNIDFNTEFYARKRFDQANWEFDDKETHTTFKGQLIGEIADATHGTNLKGKGNFKAPKSDPTLRINDKSNVKNIIVLRKMAGSNVKAEKAFLNQTVPLNNIYEHVGEDDKRTSLSPSNGNCNNWLDTTAASDADKRPSDLIVVHLLKKFDTPKTTSNRAEAKRVTKRMRLSDDEDNNATMKEMKTNHKNEENVVLGAFYDPCLLRDYSSTDFALVKNKLVQHDIRDIDNQLIPAWKLEEGLRPGNVVLVSVSLHIYNIQNRGEQTGFRRFYQINAERIKVINGPIHNDEEPSSSPQELVEAKTTIHDDFDLFTSKKRKDEETTDDDHSTKKKKTEKTSEDAEDYKMAEDD